MDPKRINLVAADMGYGHQRAAFPLLDLGREIITINDYPGIPDWERQYWLKNLRIYEAISRFKKIPLIGQGIFAVMDYFQRIEPFYPVRDLSPLSFQQKAFLKALKKGLGKDLITRLSQTNQPIVTTFFVAAYAAEFNDYQGDVYCIICDSDVSRAWGPLWPKTSRTKFLAPNERVKARLQMYGVKEKNIFVTGFPLPKDNVGFNQEILKVDLEKRLLRLDPQRQETAYYHDLIKDKSSLSKTDNKVEALTISFAVGGAGAQKEIGAGLLEKLNVLIKTDLLKINLIAGSRPEVRNYFQKEIKRLGLANNPGVKIIFAEKKLDYFKKFNQCLRTTDVLWTKPSELSFYSGLGLPIIISSPVGSQEDSNREWLLSIGAGLDALPLDYIEDWWSDWIASGCLARAAVDGYLNAASRGTYEIEKFFNN